jgi:hypothetical protein
MAFVSRPGRDRWDRDPEYLRNRATLRAQRRPCARCGGAIAYDESYWITIGGRRRVNPRAFVAGHIISRHRGGSHALSNLQAEHAACSFSSGAEESNGHTSRRLERDVKVIPTARPDTASRW